MPGMIPFVLLLLRVRMSVVTACMCASVHAALRSVGKIWTAFTGRHWSFCVTQRHGIH